MCKKGLHVAVGVTGLAFIWLMQKEIADSGWGYGARVQGLT